MGELQISDGRPEVLQELVVAFGLHGLNPEWEQGHTLAQKGRSLGTGKTGCQDHHLLAGEAVHSTEVIDRFARTRGQPLAVPLYQDAGCVHYNSFGRRSRWWDHPSARWGWVASHSTPGALRRSTTRLMLLPDSTIPSCTSNTRNFSRPHWGALLLQRLYPLDHPQRRLALAYPLGPAAPRLQSLQAADSETRAHRLIVSGL